MIKDYHISEEKSFIGFLLCISLVFSTHSIILQGVHELASIIGLVIYFVLCFTTIPLSLSKFYPDSCFHNSWFNKLYHATVWILCEMCSYSIIICLWIEATTIAILSSLNHILLIQHHIFKSNINVYIYLVKLMRFGLYMTWINLIAINIYPGLMIFELVQIGFMRLYTCFLVTYISETSASQSETELVIVYATFSSIPWYIAFIKGIFFSYWLLPPKPDPELESTLLYVYGFLWFCFVFLFIVRFSYMNNTVRHIEDILEDFEDEFTLEDFMEYFQIDEAYCKHSKYIQL
ncbi:uncharacterized protein LOC116349353 isoform X2 [Contarinia nasturtii]|uniref:uncharacterized protein LOC116349353 isoform X2 n=1 Tax=Contarinia nasturtii TaxID=265458 RepID=UPI0012D3EBAE|nr:uncharacterized protein LOC116349353 isoform X2 [Contarinia nasturtii]